MSRNKINLFSAILFQAVTILSGLILPRLVISTFGSEINGLVSSINQFLSFISLFEGGLGAVVLAALYKPLENKNKFLVSQILDACSIFFRKLSLFFLLYTAVLMLIYPILFIKEISFGYISSLVFILSITTLMQYMFSITYKLLLQADQKIYITNFASILTVILNIIVAIIIIELFPSIHLVKIGASAVFLLQPIIYGVYVKKHYNLERKIKCNGKELKDTKSAFSQNFAHFICMNTDVIVITIFSSLTNVSIYTVYMLALSAVRNVICTGANSYQAVFGKYIARNDSIVLKEKFKKFEITIWIISIVCFSTSLLLINQFVEIYTSDVKDANYYEPLFALFMIIAQFYYTVREPYRLLILAAGKFRETNFGSYMEVIINLAISVILVNRLGITGVAIGTLCAILYRLFYFIYFLRGNIIYIRVKQFLLLFLLSLSIFAVNILVYYYFKIQIYSFMEFILYGMLFLMANMIITCTLYLFIKIIFKFYDRLVSC